MACLSVTSNVFFSVAESCFFHEKFPIFHFRSLEKTYYPHTRRPTGKPSSLHYQTVWFIYCSNTAAGTATTRPMVCFPHWRVISCGALWVVRFFKSGGGGLLQNLILEGDSEAPFTASSAISYSHMASALAGQSRVSGQQWEGIRSTQPLAAKQRQLPI